MYRELVRSFYLALTQEEKEVVTVRKAVEHIAAKLGKTTEDVSEHKAEIRAALEEVVNESSEDSDSDREITGSAAGSGRAVSDGTMIVDAVTGDVPIDSVNDDKGTVNKGKKRKAEEKTKDKRGSSGYAYVAEDDDAPLYWDKISTNAGGMRKAAVVATKKMPKTIEFKKSEPKLTDEGVVIPKKQGKKVGPMSMSPELQGFLGVSSPLMLRQDVSKKIIDYMKEKGLQNEKDKREFLLDDKLQALFKVKKVTYFSVHKFISKHLKDPKFLV